MMLRRDLAPSSTKVLTTTAKQSRQISILEILTKVKVAILSARLNRGKEVQSSCAALVFRTPLAKDQPKRFAFDDIRRDRYAANPKSPY